MRVRVSCSPDADDLFMMRALMEGAIDTGPYRFEVEARQTDALNHLAHSPDAPEVCAVSIAWMPYLAGRYKLLTHGASFGEGYGPALVTRAPADLRSLTGKRVAIPGLTTTAWATLRQAVEVEPVVIPIVPHERVFEALDSGEVDAALLIHEGRLTYQARGLHLVLDIGAWWAETTGGQPLPLGGNCIRADLGEHTAPISRLLQQSIAHALANRDDAINWLMAKGSALRTAADVSQYLDMYANGRTLDMGEDGQRAVLHFLEQAARAGVVPHAPVVFQP